MVVSSRGILAIGLSLAGLGASWSVHRSVSRRMPGPQDGEPGRQGQDPRHRSLPIIGTVDIETRFQQL